MKKKFLFVLLAIFSVTLANAQDVDKYKERYDKGERSETFVKEYIDFLMSKNAISPDEELVVDKYLMNIPCEKRYSGYYYKIFDKLIKDYKKQSFIDLINNWSKIVKVDNSVSIKDKLKSIYLNTLFNFEYEKIELPEDYILLMSKAIVNLDEEDMKFYKILLDLSIAKKHSDFKKINILTEELFSEVEYSRYTGIVEIHIISSAWNLVLDNAELKETKDLLNNLKKILLKHNNRTIKSICEDLEGKVMMIENY